MKVNLENTYWDRIYGYPTELRVDARWILRKHDSERSYGQLRIVSHPDLPPGHLRSIFIAVTDIEEKNDHEIMQTIEDYKMEIDELEVYSVDEKIETEKMEYEGTLKELEDMFNVKVFK